MVKKRKNSTLFLSPKDNSFNKNFYYKKNIKTLSLFLYSLTVLISQETLRELLDRQNCKKIISKSVGSIYNNQDISLVLNNETVITSYSELKSIILSHIITYNEVFGGNLKFEKVIFNLVLENLLNNKKPINREKFIYLAIFLLQKDS